MSAPLAQNGTHESDKAFDTGSAGKYQAQEIEQVPSRRTYGSRVKRHCARRWWIHLLIFCVVFLIIALCLVYVAMPKIAQHGVNESSIEFTEIDFLDPTSESIVLTQKAILHSPSMYTPTLDSFTASLWLVTNGTFGAAAMMQIPMPQIHALHPESTSEVKGINASIENLEQVTNYATTVLTQEYVTTALTGRTKLHEGKLPTTWVNYNSSSTYKGLNGLKGFNVTGVKINLTATPDTPNLSGFAYIPNPSVLTVAMGNVTLIISTPKAGILGNSTINDMTLVPGNNTLPMTGILDQNKVLSSMNSTTGIVTLTITGNSSTYNGQHLTYYESALQSNVLTLDMNVFAVLGIK